MRAAHVYLPDCVQACDCVCGVLIYCFVSCTCRVICKRTPSYAVYRAGRIITSERSCHDTADIIGYKWLRRLCLVQAQHCLQWIDQYVRRQRCESQLWVLCSYTNVHFFNHLHSHPPLPSTNWQCSSVRTLQSIDIVRDGKTEEKRQTAFIFPLRHPHWRQVECS